MKIDKEERKMTDSVVYNGKRTLNSIFSSYIHHLHQPFSSFHIVLSVTNTANKRFHNVSKIISLHKICPFVLI